VATVSLHESSLEKIGRIFAETYKLKVIFKGDNCSTDGKTIYLPAIPSNAPKDLIDAIHGFLDHEVAHILFSHFNICRETKKLGAKHFQLMNCIEDVRVELEMCNLWRGSKINLANCREWALKQDSSRWDEATPFSKLALSINRLFWNGYDHWFSEKHIKSDIQLLETLKYLEPLTNKINNLKSTEESLNLAKEIMEALKEKEDDQDMSSFIAKLMESVDRDITEDMKDLSARKIIRNKVKSLQKTAKNNKDRYLVYSTEQDQIEKIISNDPIETTKFLAESRVIVNSIKQKFRRNLLSKTINKWETGFTRGTINGHALRKVALGTGKDVFKRKITSEGFNTVASLYIDHSGSMAGNEIELAEKSALIFGESLNSIGVPFEICGFSTGSPNYGNLVFDTASREEQLLYTRWGYHWIGVYKGFNDSWNKSKNTILSMSTNIKFNSYEGESIRVAAQRLLARPEKRKILFVFCDGETWPNVTQFIDIHRTYLKNVAIELQKHIEVFAIGINTDAVKNFYKNYTIIRNVNDLPVVMMSELDRLLRRNINAYEKRTS
jgi:cobaltochelatase CobT